jgi:hypothetical protein
MFHRVVYIMIVLGKRDLRITRRHPVGSQKMNITSVCFAVLLGYRRKQAVRSR